MIPWHYVNRWATSTRKCVPINSREDLADSKHLNKISYFANMVSILGRDPDGRVAVGVGSAGQLGEALEDVFSEDPGKFAESRGLGDKEIGTGAESGLPIGFHR